MTTTTTNYIELAREYFRLEHAKQVLAFDNACHDEARMLLINRQMAILNEVHDAHPHLTNHTLLEFMHYLNGR